MEATTLTVSHEGGNNEIENLVEKWHHTFLAIHTVEAALDTYKQPYTNDLTKVKMGPPTWLTAQHKASWLHQFQLTLRNCIAAIQLPAQRTLLRKVWEDLNAAALRTNSKEYIGWRISRGLKRGSSKIYNTDYVLTEKVKEKHVNTAKEVRGGKTSQKVITFTSSAAQPPPPPPSLPSSFFPPPPPFFPPLPPVPQPPQHKETFHAITKPQTEGFLNEDKTDGMEAPPFLELLRGEDFTPLRNIFEIFVAFKPTEEVAEVLAFGIFGSRKKVTFLYRSLYKFMLWYERVERETFKPGMYNTKKGKKEVIYTWGKWKEVVRKGKCRMDEKQVNIIARLYQVQIRFFRLGEKAEPKFVCTGQTKYLQHRVVNILQKGSMWTLLQGTTAPVLKYDNTVGKFDTDYYLAGCNALLMEERRGNIAGKTVEQKEGELNVAIDVNQQFQVDRGESKSVIVNRDAWFNNSTLSEITSSVLLSPASIERRLGIEKEGVLGIENKRGADSNSQQSRESSPSTRDSIYSEITSSALLSPASIERRLDVELQGERLEAGKCFEGSGALFPKEPTTRVSTYSEITSSALLSPASIERCLDIESEGERLEEEKSVEGSEFSALFPEELVITRPKKLRISKREIWQKRRNAIRSKNKIARKKYVAALAHEERRKDSQKSVFDYTTVRLTESEIDILSKGETFCPTTHKIDVDRLKTDIYKYSRKLRLHEQFRDKQATEKDAQQRRGRSTITINRNRMSNRKVSTLLTTTPIVDSTSKQRRLPSTYDPLTQNRNLNRYTTCIQEDCLLAIKSEVNIRDNIHKHHRAAIKTLTQKIESKTIMITKADKGSGIVVCDYNVYVEKGTKYIEQEAGAYSKVINTETDLIAKLIKQRNKIVDKLRKESVISLQTATFSTKQVEEKITGMKFYFKIHKDQNIATTPLRPLQSCISAPTHHLSLVLTDILQPLLTTKHIPSFIYDSNHLLFRLKTLGAIPDNCTIISSDVSALYPSIPHEQGLEATSKFLTRHTQYNSTQIEAIMQALKLVISENYVMWNDTIYKQTSGVAMGTPVAVAYANIFMAWIDRTVRQQTDYIHEHIRFIDDNLFIIPEEKIDDLMNLANNILPSIKYTHETLDKDSEKGLAFLDTQLFISQQRHIEARLYTKPTDRHAYLLPSSYHPPHIVKNIPSAVFKRLRRLCSKKEWYLEDAEKAKSWLKKRGYKDREIDKACETAANLDRWEMIVKIELSRGSVKGVVEETCRIPFIVTYNKYAKVLKQVLVKRQQLLDSSYKYSKVKPRVTFRRQKNLDDILIQKALRGPIRTVDKEEWKFVKCGEKQQYRGVCPCGEAHEVGLCRCCAHASWDKISEEVKLRKGVDCNTKNVVYLIGCRKCEKQYIGETQQTVRDRLAQHLRNISKLNQPLYLHFRLVHHPRDLFITILETVRSTEQFFRKVRESWWINHLQTLEPKGFNAKLDCNQIYQERQS